MNYEIKKVEIGTFNNINPTGRIQSGKYIYNALKNVTRTIICIIDWENNVAVDIKDFNKKYMIIKRNKYNQVLPNQNIAETEEYALSIKELSPEDISILKSILYRIKVNKYDKEEKRKK